jgi:GH25 family lysozyme M1 (1,4-beta-N-acetylmuramidase)
MTFNSRTGLPLLTTILASAALSACALSPDDMTDDGDMHFEEDTLGSTIRIHEPTEGPAPIYSVTRTPGMDVSNYQGAVNWAAAKANGAQFAYIKATEGTTYRNPSFAQQYNGSYNVGMVRGAYHFALPNVSSGATQANFFVSHGGGWSNDGRTLPPVIDLEYNPYGATCYGLSRAAMVAWIHDFSNVVKARTGREPAIYTTTNWWVTCTGNSAQFSANPLWIARYNTTVGALPASWGYYTFWQTADHGIFPGDQNVFNGALDRLHAFTH